VRPATRRPAVGDAAGAAFAVAFGVGAGTAGFAAAGGGACGGRLGLAGKVPAEATAFVLSATGAAAVTGVGVSMIAAVSLFAWALDTAVVLNPMRPSPPYWRPSTWTAAAVVADDVVADVAVDVEAITITDVGNCATVRAPGT